MRAIFRICVNESQPGLQMVEKLGTPLVTDLLLTNVFILIIIYFYLGFFLILTIVIAIITIIVFMTLVIRPLPAAICSAV